MLNWHKSSVIEQGRKSVHHRGAKLSRIGAISPANVLLGEALGAESHSCREVEVFLAEHVRLTHLELLFL